MFEIHDIIHEGYWPVPKGILIHGDLEKTIRYCKENGIIKCKIIEMYICPLGLVCKKQGTLPENWQCDNAEKKLLEKEKWKCGFV